MSDTRPTLSTSLSFTTTSSTNATRVLKRRLTSASDLPFFTPAAASFKPKPYTPNGSSVPVPPPPKLQPAMRTHSASSLVQHMPMMDPSLSDPNIIFIHPPFVAFPNAHLYPEGLSYSLMAANPDWFLDQNDFVNGSSTNSDAIPYPPQLEPPRGWCPAKKKDLKALGPDGWPEGEEPRLRCTFCRRTYAGVNAKSMWRRHVYEKHKIAMSNRREGHDRTRGGRGSGRERNHHHDKENYTDDRRGSRGPENKSRKSRTLSSRNSITPTPDPEDDDDADDDDLSAPSAPVIKQNEFPALSSPPVLKHPRPLDEGVTLTDSYDLRASQVDDSSASPKISRFAVPMSPYDPTLTPSFRHSPPRLPSDQPWRFPSPSHPLHSGAREFCLSMLARATPATKGCSVIDSSSPSTGTTSVMNTPRSTTFRGKTFGDLGSIFTEGSSPIIFRPSPRHLFSDSRSPVPVFTRLDFRKRLNDSPLGGGLRRKPGHDRKKTAMNNSFDLQGGWLSDNSLSSSVSSLSSAAIPSPARLTSDDPFGSPFKPLESTLRHPPEKRVISLPQSSPEAESPVIRHFRLPDNETPESNDDGLVGLGIGLMAPFDLSTSHISHREAEEKDEAEVEGVLLDVADDLAPPSKKRRVTFG
ncbi:hypothetical protein DFJ58DRAFT_679110 [Suillus subalutaceus]|uniref:uncharacterized protein n=1 Tax=Suillus subalutaceus TaxID=48586 RepID=UPI001B87C6FC|nr:uncharacterized protein DFJ58DRAFT_679110 [Suillus subalutaceus]KAG1867953.1 hypothetical protein DFJ58DRAFT_679110 [Suillus subalutaceus]